MLQKNKGSILIICLIVFSIIVTVCITTVSLVYSNINVSSLQLKNLQLKEKSLGTIDIVYSNMKNEINNAIDITNNSSEFINYIKKDNYKNFINKCKDISNSDLDNITITLTNKTNFGEFNNLDFNLKIVAVDGVYKKDTTIKIRVKNPWYEDFSDYENDNILENQELEKTEVLTEDIDIKENLKNKKLITMYSYEEL